MCSDKHCHKSLQIIGREKSKDVRIKGRHLLFVSMQDFLFFKVVITHISLRCISNVYLLIVSITKRGVVRSD